MRYIGAYNEGAIITPPKQFINRVEDTFTCDHLDKEGKKLVKRIWIERISIERVKEVEVHVDPLSLSTKILKNVDVEQIEVWYKFPNKEWELRGIDKVVINTKDSGKTFWVQT